MYFLEYIYCKYLKDIGVSISNIIYNIFLYANNVFLLI